MIRCNLTPVRLAERLGSFASHCSNTGVEWTLNKSQHWIRVRTQSWLRRGKFSHRPCRDSNSQPFDHKSGAQSNKLSQLLWLLTIKTHDQPFKPLMTPAGSVESFNFYILGTFLWDCTAEGMRFMSFKRNKREKKERHQNKASFVTWIVTVTALFFMTF